MMVEAGAKILPEDVMAEAIMFGHRALQPLIDLQDQLREQVGKAKRTAVPRARAPSPCSTSSTRSRTTSPFVVFDVETTSRDAKLGAIVEIGAVKVKDGKIDRSLVHAREPGNADRRRASSTASPTRTCKAPVAAAGGPEVPGLGRRRAARRPQRRLRHRVPRGGPRRRHQDRAGSLPRHAGARPRGISRPGRLQAGRPGQVLRAQDPADAPGTTDAEATAEFLIRLANELPQRVETFKSAVADSIRCARTGGDPTPPTRRSTARKAASRLRRA